jgi:ATP-binding protein involved in chromosome partitioning
MDDPTAAAVREALADAAVGRDILTRDLAAVSGIGPIETDGEQVTVTVTVPIPRGLQSTVAEDVREAVGGVDGIDGVEVRFEPDPLDVGARVDFIPEVSNVVAVGSAKGGVGKTTVAVNLATALASAGADVGLVDADVYGPNAPSMLGLDRYTPATTHDDLIVPRIVHGLNVMSMDFIVEEDDPVIWRGPLVDDFLQQLFDDVDWGALDYLVVDMPPGTGDAQLSLVQHLPVAGAVIVTTPDEVAVDDARRGLRGFAEYGVPILGLVANMTRFECPDCGTEHALFGEDRVRQLGAEFDVPVLGHLPLDPKVGALHADTDGGRKGIPLPLIGRLQLPRRREERERQSTLPPVAIREGGGEARRAFELMAARTALRLNAAALERRD